MLARLRDLHATFEVVGDVRGRGAMLALELVADRATKEPAKQVTQRVIEEAYRQGVILLKAGTFDNVVRLLPPLTIEEGLLDEGLDVLEKSLASAAAL
jgi:4-aminobutyrate aminotransferase/(S)-3-amino-2-methylpropionate transaminase